MESFTGMRNRLRTQIPKLQSPFKNQHTTDLIPEAEESTNCSNLPDTAELVKIKKPKGE
jgi:hypothetical protein